MTDFQNAMSRKTDEQLLKIVEYDFHKFHPDAVKAASEVLASRNIDQEQLDEIKSKLHEEVVAENEANTKKENTSFGINLSGVRNDSLDAKENFHPNDEKIINIVSYLFLGLFMLSIYNLRHIFYFDVTTIAFNLIEALALIVIAVGLYKRKKVGLLTLLFLSATHVIISVFFTAYEFISYNNMDVTFYENGSNTTYYLILLGIIAIKIAALIFFTVFFFKPRILEKYNIEHRTAKTSLFAGALLGLIYFMAITKLTLAF